MTESGEIGLFYIFNGKNYFLPATDISRQIKSVPYVMSSAARQTLCTPTELMRAQGIGDCGWFVNVLLHRRCTPTT